MKSFLIGASMLWTAYARDMSSFMDPPCGISKEVFYEKHMLTAQVKCWDSTYTPCMTDCSHLKSILKHYWNTDDSCEPIHSLANEISTTAPLKADMKFFPNRKDCGHHNGQWILPDGKYYPQISHSTTKLASEKDHS